MKASSLGLLFSIFIHGLLLSFPAMKNEEAPEKRTFIRMSRIVPPPAAPEPPPRQEPKKPKETVRPKPEPSLQQEVREDRIPEKEIEPPAPDETKEVPIDHPLERDTEGAAAEQVPHSPPPVEPLTEIVETPSDSSSLDEEWLTRLLWDRVNTLKRYPYLARRNSWEGDVVVKVVIGGDGSLVRAEIIESSGYSALDEDALSLVRRAMQRKLEMEETPFWDSATILIPVAYRLRG